MTRVRSKREKLSLAVTDPDLAKEADGWNPSTVSRGSGLKKSWKCNLGHTYESQIAKRALRGHGCPICSGHQVLAGYNDLATTHPELSAEAVDSPVTNRSAGSNEIISWRCGLGHTYESQIAKRASRGHGCPICSGHRVLKGFNDLGTTHPNLVTQALGWDVSKLSAGSNELKMWKCSLGHTYQSAISKRAVRDQGCPFCSGHKVWFGFNDLATTHPELSSEAVDEPVTIYSAGSNQLIEWRCKLGHIYSARITKRVSGTSCPFCASGGKKKILPGFNDLATTHPALAIQAHGWEPSKKSMGQDTKVKWKCEKGHIWVATIVKRSSGQGCPSCSTTGYDPNEKGYLYFLFHENWQIYKIGISNSKTNRTDKHIQSGWEVLEMRGPMNGVLAYEWEQSILRMLKAKGADLSNSKIAGKFDGYSEAWSKSTFEVSSIKELMRLTEEYEAKSNH